MNYLLPSLIILTNFTLFITVIASKMPQDALLLNSILSILMLLFVSIKVIFNFKNVNDGDYCWLIAFAFGILFYTSKMANSSDLIQLLFGGTTAIGFFTFMALGFVSMNVVKDKQNEY